MSMGPTRARPGLPSQRAGAGVGPRRAQRAALIMYGLIRQPTDWRLASASPHVCRRMLGGCQEMARRRCGPGVEPVGVDGLRRLGALVRRFRVEAGLSGSELARRAGVPQPSVSRVEAGQRLSDPGVVARLAEALSLGAGAAGELTASADRAYAAPTRRRVDAGVSMVAGQLHRHITAVRLVRAYSSATVPALLRTAEYARAAGSHAAGEWVRLTALADDESRSWVFIVTEGALRTWPDQVPMAAQLARVLAMSQRPNVRLGVPRRGPRARVPGAPVPGPHPQPRHDHPGAGPPRRPRRADAPRWPSLWCRTCGRCRWAGARTAACSRSGCTARTC